MRFLIELFEAIFCVRKPTPAPRHEQPKHLVAASDEYWNERYSF